jgi:NodT family efflux transporter outer membrane factor (OMF) lipoprotein
MKNAAVCPAPACCLALAARLGLAACLALALLGACAVGPDYHPPAFPAPAAYVEIAPATAATTGTDTTGTGTGTTAAEADLSAWWLQFHDATLTALIERGLRDSPTLAIAASRIRAARQKALEAAAAGMPSVTATGSALALRTGGGTLPAHLNLYSAGFDATWEADLFGASRRAVEAADATTGASIWDRRDGQVSLGAEIASDYFLLRALQARIRVGNEELGRQKQLLALVEARRHAGFVTELVVNQQSTLVLTAAAQIPQLDAEARGELHALGTLLGELPDALAAELAPLPQFPASPPPLLPPGLPSELLQRRPDIRAAERRLAAGSAEVGVRTAALYPSFDLVGVATFAGSALNGLFSRQDLVKAALGLVTEPVFDGGRRRAVLGEAREGYTQAELGYRVAVLGALRDVEDSLARHRAEQARHELLLQALQSAESTLAIAEGQYRTGFVTFVNVVQAEYVVLGARDQLVQSDASQATDLVAIYKALGGGWSATRPD